MKNINKYLGLVAFGAIALTSCDDSILDVSQYDKIEIAGEFESNQGALAGLTGIYDLMNPNGAPDADWGFKPNVFSGTHPTMDTQATGWDANYNRQDWDAGQTEIANGWAQAYTAIARANLFLSGLREAKTATPIVGTNGKVTYANGAGVSEEVKRYARGEALALHGFFYTYLAQTFGRVPLLKEGEDYNTNPTKAKAKDYSEMWDLIIDDFVQAKDLLDWKPFQGEYGRATKGMAKAYLADAYMWKAYRLGCDTLGVYQQSLADQNASKIKELYEMAEKELYDIIKHGPYKLSPCFSTNWDASTGGWNDECIWALLLDEGQYYSGGSSSVSSMNLKFYTACPENGGWGSLYLSWEWYAAYEQGDKRRDASCVIGGLPYSDLKKLYKYANKSNADALDKLPELQVEYDEKENDLKDAEAAFEDAMDKYSKESAEYKNAEQALANAKAEFNSVSEALNKVQLYNHGYHPFLQQNVGNGTPETKTKQFHYINTDYAPAIWSAKLWRNGSAADVNGMSRWSIISRTPTPIYWKRYSNVLLDYAECRFRLYGEDDAEAWAAIQQVRDRGFGKNEKGLDDAKYITWLNTMASIYKLPQLTSYPIPFDQDGVGAPDAKTYYTQYAKCNIHGLKFSSPVWKVAVNEERRKEFSCEWCLRPDLQRSGYMTDHIATNYPVDETNGDALANYPWSHRTFTYNEMKMDFPIPADEIAKNPACIQNPAYR